MNHYTTIEQSKKLLELGLSSETADMFYGYDDHFTVNPTEKDYSVEIGKLPFNADPYLIPCWSLGALLEVMPVVLHKVGKFKLDYTLHTTGHKRIVYSHKMMVFHKENGKNLIEAAYSMVVYLLENGYIKKKESLKMKQL